MSEPDKRFDTHGEAVRIRRLRLDAARPMAVNLAEGIAHSRKLMSFTGAATRAAASKKR